MLQLGQEQLESDFNLRNMIYMMYHKNPDRNDDEQVQEYIKTLGIESEDEEVELKVQASGTNKVRIEPNIDFNEENSMAQIPLKSSAVMAEGSMGASNRVQERDTVVAAQGEGSHAETMRGNQLIT